MNIISASRRTDIPAWYGEWFLNRLRAGYAVYRNPFGGQYHRVSVRPDDVIAFVFWTRNALPFLPILDRHVRPLYRSIFLYTINGYGPPLEPHAHDQAESIAGFERISELLGPDSVHWRYDPIVLSERMTRDDHLRAFEETARKLEGKTSVCHTSFVQFYKKTSRRLNRLAEETGDDYGDRADGEKIALAEELKDQAAARGIELVSCCAPLLDRAGLRRGRCIDPALIARLRPDLADLNLKPRPTREGCGCAASRDIGAYNTCRSGCVYCYATDSAAGSAADSAAEESAGESPPARTAFENHDPHAECL